MSDANAFRAAADRNLLFGIVALQMDFITRDQLIAAMNAWVLDKAKPLGQILLEQKALASGRHTLLEALVEEHLKQHGGDAEKSLAAVRSVGSVRQQLQDIADPDVQASVGHIGKDQPPEDDPYATRAPTTVGMPTSSGLRFLILRPHARGGLGQVSIAHDVELGREVALKEIQLRYADEPHSRSRFVLEAEITGGLEHPGIVPVYGLGQYADGRPFYAMRFIKGDSLKDAIAAFHQADVPGRDPGERTLALRKLLERFVDVCNAIAYAHSRGVLHRDLKPGNIMLGKYGETLVVDWGLAKPLALSEEASAVEDQPLRPASASGSAATVAGKAMGTPAYMSPEQAAGRLDLLGPASDVYSLGATLYCLLTGQAPFAKNEEGDILDRVQRGNFPAPRKVKTTVPAALEAVCLKAMGRKPEHRYGTVRALADDIDHWLADEPVSAQREPLSVRAGRWMRRHRPVLAGTGALLVTAVIALAVSTVLISEEQKRTSEARQKAETLATSEGRLRVEADEKRKLAEKRKTEADAARGEAEKQKGLAEQGAKDLAEALGELQTKERTIREKAARLALIMGPAADHAWDAGNTQQAQDLLLEIPSEFRGWEWRYRRRHFQGSYCTLYGHTATVSSVAFSPDGQRLASGSFDKTVKVWDARTGQELLILCGHTQDIGSVAFSPDGQRLASGSVDKTVKVWDARTGQELLTLRGHTGTVLSVAFSPDGQRLASGSYDKTVKVWDAHTGQELLPLRGHTNWVLSVAFSPDGQRLATGSFDKTVKVWDAHTGQELLPLRGHLGEATSVAFSPDGQRLASGSVDKTVKVWDARTGQELLTLRGHTGEVVSVAFSPNGQRLASGNYDKTVKVWDAHTGQELLSLRGHTSWVLSVAFSLDGQRLASGSDDKTVKVWDARTGQGPLTLRGHTGTVAGVAFSPDGQRLASGSWDKTVKVWDARTGQELLPLRGHTGEVASVAFSPDGQRLATGSYDKTVKVWDAHTGQGPLTLRGHTEAVASVAFSPDSQRLASGSVDQTVKVWDARTGQELLPLRGHTGAVSSVAFSPDGQRLATGSYDKTVKVWDARTGQELLPLRGHTGAVVSVAFSPDGQRLASGSVDKTVKVWDARTGQEVLSLRGHTNMVFSVAFSPDGQRLATGSYDKTVKVWDARTGQEVLSLRGHTEDVASVAFNPDGQRLATGSYDKTVKVWDARTGQEVRTLRGHTGDIMGVAFSPDGKQLFSQGPERLTWDVKTGTKVPTPKGHFPLTNRGGARHPSRPLLAVTVGDRIELIGLTAPDSSELGFREGMARFDASWQWEEAQQCEKESRWFAAAFHWGQLAEWDPSYLPYSTQLDAACTRLGNWQPALAVCDRLLRQDPALAPLYFRRARLRAHLLQFSEATADHLIGLAVVSRNPIGWPRIAAWAYDAGYKSAQKNDWPSALRHYSDAVFWERQNPWLRFHLAWAQLAAGQDKAFRATCLGMYNDHASTKDVEGHYRLTADLGLGLAAGPSYVRGLGRPAADAILRSMQHSRNEAIVYTACIVPNHGLPAAKLLRLAEANVQQVHPVFDLENLGAAQYRAGKYTEACKTLEGAMWLRNGLPSNWAKLFLAMSYHRLGERANARTAFRAVTLAKDASWDERLIFNRLTAEAAQLLKLPPNPKD